MNKINNIYNFLRLSENLATAGQPTEEQLGIVAKEGYDVVINLALCDADYSLPDEEKSVRELGMEYIHLPVIWPSPTTNDLEMFFDLMQKHKNKKLFIHCAANMRVSSFIMLYRVIKQDWDYTEAAMDMHKIWNPNQVWTDFIQNQLARYDAI